MYTFLIVTSFVMMATAAPNGYNYQQQTSSSFGAVNNRGSYSSQQSPPPPPPHPAPQQISFNVNSPLIAAPAPGLFIQPAPQAAASTTQYFGQTQQQSGFIPNSLHNAQPQLQTIVSKNIYIHSAPEETEVIGNNAGATTLGPVRKHYRIVFIKAPSHNIRINTEAIKQSQALNEEKTVIYVLSKKPDISNIHNELASAQTTQKASKPEVYFIKYKTQDEANRAQQEIQAQYEALGGSTQISDEGIAPVTNIIGGGSVNVASASAATAPSFFSSSSSVQAASNNHQSFVKQSFQRN